MTVSDHSSLKRTVLNHRPFFSLITPYPLLRSPERESTIDLMDNSPQMGNIRDRSPSEVWHDYVSDWEQFDTGEPKSNQANLLALRHLKEALAW
jgi:hypothetical protein